LTDIVPVPTARPNPYVLAGAGILVALCLAGAIYVGRRPCPCAEHKPEAEAARIAQASAQIATEEPISNANGHMSFPDLDQPEPRK
jgi:hypothetical protein